MDQRAEPRVETEKKVHVTILRGEPVMFPALVVNISEGGMRLLSDRPLEIGAPVGVEWDDSLMLGEVCYSEPAAGGYAIGLALEHCLRHTSEIAQLARRLMGDPQRPAGAPPGECGQAAEVPVKAKVRRKQREL